MAQGCTDQQWNHTSEILAVLYNSNRDPGKKPQPWTAKDFHPAHQKKEKAGLPWRMAAGIFENQYGVSTSKPTEQEGR